jgi:hypothetical protein
MLAHLALTRVLVPISVWGILWAFQPLFCRPILADLAGGSAELRQRLLGLFLGFGAGDCHLFIVGIPPFLALFLPKKGVINDPIFS